MVLKRIYDFFVQPVIDLVEQAISWIFPMPEIPDFGDSLAEDYAKGVLLNKVSSNASIPIVYGTRKIGGTRIFVETSGEDNQYLYVAFVLCEGEINAISKIYIDEKELIVDNAYAHGTAQTSTGLRSVIGGSASTESTTDIIVQPFFGTDNQVASSTLTALSSWGSNHKLSGLCYLAFRFNWNQDVFGQIPNITAIIQGKKVVAYNSSSVAQTSAFSTNPAWCLLDYLTNERYGKGLAISQINIPSFYTASGVCDTNVTPYTSGSAINIFDCNGVIDTSAKVLDNVRAIINGCRGFLPYTSGKYSLVIETTGSASVTLTQDDIIGGINIKGETLNTKYNRVIVTYTDPEENYQANTVQFPPIDDSGEASADRHATMKTLDTKVLEGFFDFSKTITNYYQAQEMAEIILRRSRDAIQVDIKASAEATNISIGDIIGITHSSPSWTAKTFRVLGMGLNEDHTVDLNCIEHNDSIYTWSSKPVKSTTPNTTLPNPFTVGAPASITLTDELIEYSEGVALTRLNILIGASTDKFIQYYIVEAKLSTESDFKVVAKGVSLNYEMLNVLDDKTYNVRAKAINTLGVSSSYVTANRLIVGATEPPSDVVNFSVNMQGSNQMQLNWDSVDDLDIAYYEIRYQNVSSNSQWNKSVNWLQVPRSSGTTTTVNARTGAFLIKAVDKLGNESNNETIIYSNIASLQAFKVVQTITETISAGTFDSDVALTDRSGTSSIVLDTITDFDDTVGNFDSPSGDFDLGGTDTTSNVTYSSANIDNEGFYSFANSFSLSAVYDCSFASNITIDQIEDPYDLFDSGRGFTNFDDAPAPFDGNDPTNATAQIQVASSETSLGDCTVYYNLNSAGTYKGRYFKFRLRLANKNNKVVPFVSGLSITLNMEKRDETGEDIASTTSAKAITYTNKFYANPSIGIAAQNMATGDFYTISNKAVTGFTIQFFNSSGSGVNRTFDYMARGYGLG